MKKITPLKDLLLIKLDERQQTTAAGLYFQQAWESVINTGEVLASGPLATTKPNTRVIMNPYALLGSGVDGQFLIKEADIVATVEEVDEP